jgi:restriction system protein
MAEITARRRGELVRGVFKVLLAHPDGLPAKEVIKRVESELQLTDFEKSDFARHPGVRRFDKHVRFATIKAVKAGWLIKKKGEWSLSDTGREAYRAFQNPEEFEREAHRLYKQWKGQQPPEDVEQEPSDEEDISPQAALEEAEENAWREVEEHLTSMAPYDFQHLVAALLRGMGYHVAWIAPPGKDGGIDIVAHTDPLGTRVPRIKVQVKRRQEKVTVDGLRSFMAVLGDQDVGIFVSTSGFTKEAEAEARAQEKRQLTLVDLERLFDLWVEHYKKLDETDRAMLPLRPVYYLAATE